jgi:hypothetical protein
VPALGYMWLALCALTVLQWFFSQRITPCLD